MKFSKQRPVGKNSKSWYKKAEHRGYAITINWSEPFDCYFYQVAKDKDSYSSLWDNITFDTEEQCVKAVQKYVEGML